MSNHKPDPHLDSCATGQLSRTVERVVSRTNALGQTSLISYNPLNLVMSVSDPLQNSTGFTYDANGNLLTVTDARQHTTTYTYDNMDRVQTRTDPLTRQESYSYDKNGNLLTFTDRKNQVTSFQYDHLNRRTFAGFGTVAGIHPRIRARLATFMMRVTG